MQRLRHTKVGEMAIHCVIFTQNPMLPLPTPPKPTKPPKPAKPPDHVKHADHPKHAEHANHAKHAEHIPQGLDHVPWLPDDEEPCISQKRPNEQGSSTEASMKKPKFDANSFMPAFGFNSILDEAMRSFEEQMSSL